MAGRSGKAWADVKKNPEYLGFMQARAVMYILLHPESTARELSQFAGDTESATIRRRLSELEREGYIRRTGARDCTVTGKQASTYVACNNSKVKGLLATFSAQLLKSEGMLKFDAAEDALKRNPAAEGDMRFSAGQDGPDYNCQGGV